MSFGAAMKSPPLDATRKPMAFGSTSNFYKVLLLKTRNGDFVTVFYTFNICYFYFFDYFWDKSKSSNKICLRLFRFLAFAVTDGNFISFFISDHRRCGDYLRYWQSFATNTEAGCHISLDSDDRAYVCHIFP